MFRLFVILALSVALLVQCKPGKRPDRPGNKPAATDSAAQRADGRMNPAANDQEPVPVEVVTITKGDISNYILLSSNLETEIMADVYSRVQGIVDSIFKEEGQYVKKDEVMLTLEAKEYILKEKKARLEYEKQKSAYERLAAMYQKNLMSKEEFEKAKYAMETARVQWDEAKLNLSYTKIKSPISGRVGERLAKIGERIQPTDKLFSVVNNSQVIAVVYVPEKNINQLKIGQKAVVYSDHLQGEKFDAWIKRISPVVDPSSGTFKVTVGVRNRKNMLRPGMFVNVNIIIDTHKDVVLIPKTAIVYENEAMVVYVVRDGVAHKIRLTPGYEDNE
ncbi:MAG TPA: efflux RND transporter periplasmic adaptor subunit, partial [Caldithrix abyssi]|nr:efflux RND transporter periplasmic adaptor subunit [Caldithrix abyssi]